MEDYRKQIRIRRQELGLTQKEVEELLGMGIGSYQRIERGRRSVHKMSFEAGLRLCAILDIDPYELLIGTTRTSYREKLVKIQTEKKI